MKGVWVKFSEHVLNNAWNPDAVGQKTKPQRRSSRFGSVPIVRCTSSARGGIRCQRLNAAGKWVECQRKTRSLSPQRWEPHKNASCALNAVAKEVKRWNEVKPTSGGEDRCQNAQVAKGRDVRDGGHVVVPPDCHTHLLDHMRCTCPACMNFACKWRRSLKRQFREQVRSGNTSPQQKPLHRWTYKIGGHTSAFPKFPKAKRKPCPHDESVREIKKYPYVGSPKVNWWYGHYVPCSSDSFTSDDAGNVQEDYVWTWQRSYLASDDMDNHDKETDRDSNCSRDKKKYHNPTNESPQTRFKRAIRSIDRQLKATQKVKVSNGEIAYDRSSESDSNVSTCSEKKDFFISTSSRTHGSETSQTNLATASRHQAPRLNALPATRNKQAKDDVEDITMEGTISNEALEDHFRSVTCASPACMMLSPGAFLDCKSGGVKATTDLPSESPDSESKSQSTWKDGKDGGAREESSRSVEEFLEEKNEMTARDSDAEHVESKEVIQDRSENKRIKGRARGRRKNTVQDEPVQDCSFMTPELQKTVESILNRDPTRTNQNVNRKRRGSSRKRSKNRRITFKEMLPHRCSSEDLSETTMYLRKYGPHQELASQLNQNTFLYKDEYGFYHWPRDEEFSNNPPDGTLSPRRHRAYRSKFLKQMGWDKASEDGDVESDCAVDVPFYTPPSEAHERASREERMKTVPTVKAFGEENAGRYDEASNGVAIEQTSPSRGERSKRRHRDKRPQPKDEAFDQSADWTMNHSPTWPDGEEHYHFHFLPEFDDQACARDNSTNGNKKYRAKHGSQLRSSGSESITEESKIWSGDDSRPSSRLMLRDGSPPPSSPDIAKRNTTRKKENKLHRDGVMWRPCLDGSNPENLLQAKQSNEKEQTQIKSCLKKSASVRFGGSDNTDFEQTETYDDRSEELCRKLTASPDSSFQHYVYKNQASSIPNKLIKMQSEERRRQRESKIAKQSSRNDSVALRFEPVETAISDVGTNYTDGQDGKRQSYAAKRNRRKGNDRHGDRDTRENFQDLQPKNISQNKKNSNTTISFSRTKEDPRKLLNETENAVQTKSVGGNNSIHLQCQCTSVPQSKGSFTKVSVSLGDGRRTNNKRPSRPSTPDTRPKSIDHQSGRLSMPKRTSAINKLQPRPSLGIQRKSLSKGPPVTRSSRPMSRQSSQIRMSQPRRSTSPSVAPRRQSKTPPGRKSTERATGRTSRPTERTPQPRRSTSPLVAPRRRSKTPPGGRQSTERTTGRTSRPIERTSQPRPRAISRNVSFTDTLKNQTSRPSDVNPRPSLTHFRSRSDSTQSAKEGRELLETVNIKGPLNRDQSRRPIVEVNIYGPLEESEASPFHAPRTKDISPNVQRKSNPPSAKPSLADANTEEKSSESKSGGSKSSEASESEAPHAQTTAAADSGDADSANASNSTFDRYLPDCLKKWHRKCSNLWSSPCDCSDDPCCPCYICDACQCWDESCNHQQNNSFTGTERSENSLLDYGCSLQKTDGCKKTPVCCSKSTNLQPHDERNAKGKGRVKGDTANKEERQSPKKTHKLSKNEDNLETQNSPHSEITDIYSARLQAQNDTEVGADSETSRYKDRSTYVEEIYLNEACKESNTANECFTKPPFEKDKRKNTSCPIFKPKLRLQRHSSQESLQSQRLISGSRRRAERREIPTGDKASTKCRSRSRSVSASRSNSKTKTKSKSSCYPFFYIENHLPGKDFKSKGNEKLTSTCTSKPPIDISIGKAKAEKQPLKKTTGRVSKYPETIWHRYVRLERENRNCSNITSDVKDEKDSFDLSEIQNQKLFEEPDERRGKLVLISQATETNNMSPVRLPRKKDHVSNSNKRAKKDFNHSGKQTCRPQSAKTHRETAVIDGWSVADAKSHRNNGNNYLWKADTDTEGEVEETSAQPAWRHASVERSRPPAGRRVHYDDQVTMISSQPTAKMVDEPVPGTAQASESHYESWCQRVTEKHTSQTPSMDGTESNKAKHKSGKKKQRKRYSSLHKDGAAEKSYTDLYDDRVRRNCQDYVPEVDTRHDHEHAQRRSSHRVKSSAGHSYRTRKRSGPSPPDSSSESSVEAFHISKHGGHRDYPNPLSARSQQNRQHTGSDNSPPTSRQQTQIDESHFQTTHGGKKSTATHPDTIRHINEENTEVKQIYQTAGSDEPRHNLPTRVHDSTETERPSVPSKNKEFDNRNKCKDLNQPEKRAFHASERVLQERSPDNEVEWQERYVSLMDECSQEKMDNSWRRVDRLQAKTRALQGSMSGLKLDFGDIETRLDKVKHIQQDYLAKAEEAVEMVRTRQAEPRSRPLTADRVRRGSHERQNKAANKSSGSAARAPLKREGTFTWANSSSNNNETSWSQSHHQQLASRPRSAFIHRQAGLDTNGTESKETTRPLPIYLPSAKSNAEQLTTKPHLQKRSAEPQHRGRDEKVKVDNDVTQCKSTRMEQEIAKFLNDLNSHSRGRGYIGSKEKERIRRHLEKEAASYKTRSSRGDISANNSNERRHSWSHILDQYRQWARSTCPESDSFWSEQSSDESDKTSTDNSKISSTMNASSKRCQRRKVGIDTTSDCEEYSSGLDRIRRGAMMKLDYLREDWRNLRHHNRRESGYDSGLSKTTLSLDESDMALEDLRNLLRNFVASKSRRTSKQLKKYPTSRRSLSRVYAPAKSPMWTKYQCSKRGNRFPKSRRKSLEPTNKVTSCDNSMTSDSSSSCSCNFCSKTKPRTSSKCSAHSVHNVGRIKHKASQRHARLASSCYSRSPHRRRSNGRFSRRRVGHLDRHGSRSTTPEDLSPLTQVSRANAVTMFADDDDTTSDCSPKRDKYLPTTESSNGNTNSKYSRALHVHLPHDWQNCAGECCDVTASQDENDAEGGLSAVVRGKPHKCPQNLDPQSCLPSENIRDAQAWDSSNMSDTTSCSVIEPKVKAFNVMENNDYKCKTLQNGAYFIPMYIEASNELEYDNHNSYTSNFVSSSPPPPPSTPLNIECEDCLSNEETGLSRDDLTTTSCDESQEESSKLWVPAVPWGFEVYDEQQNTPQPNVEPQGTDDDQEPNSCQLTWPLITGNKFTCDKRKSVPILGKSFRQELVHTDVMNLSGHPPHHAEPKEPNVAVPDELTWPRYQPIDHENCSEQDVIEGEAPAVRHCVLRGMEEMTCPRRHITEMGDVVWSGGAVEYQGRQRSATTNFLPRLDNRDNQQDRNYLRTIETPILHREGLEQPSGQILHRAGENLSLDLTECRPIRSSLVDHRLKDDSFKTLRQKIPQTHIRKGIEHMESFRELTRQRNNNSAESNQYINRRRSSRPSRRAVDSVNFPKSLKPELEVGHQTCAGPIQYTLGQRKPRLSPNPSALNPRDVGVGENSRPSHRVRFADTQLGTGRAQSARSTREYSTERWQRSAQLAPSCDRLSKKDSLTTPQRDSWETTRRVIKTLDAKERLDLKPKSDRQTLGRLISQRPKSADAGAALRRLYCQSNFTPLLNIPPPDPSLSQPGARRRSSHDSGCDTGGDLDTDSSRC